MKRIISLLIVAAMLLCLCACGKTQTATGDTPKLSFKSAMSYDYLKELDGQTVTINGYMATSSPADGSFIFLMNLPYQSCPFCKPNTSQLSNTLEVYPKKNETFDFTNQAIRITGTLEVSPSESEPFTDLYGYEFNFKITDADYTIIKAEELGEEYALWTKIAEADIVNEIYNMYDYVYFLCAWNTYKVDSWTDDDGTEQPGYYLYASDALNFINTDGAQYNYGRQDGYFEGIISKINAIDPDAFSDLTANIEKAKALAEKALAELENGNYTMESKYVEEFGTTDYVYTITAGEELQAEYDTIYSDFANWLGSWEM